MSNPNFKPAKTAAQLKAEADAKTQALKEQQDAEKLKAEQDAEANETEEIVSDYVCPLTINYVELEKLLDGKTLKEYVGDNLPKEEVKRIEIDFAIYKSNKK